MYHSDPTLTKFVELRLRGIEKKLSKLEGVSSNIPARRRRIVDPRFLPPWCDLTRLLVMRLRALPSEGVRICRDSWNTVISRKFHSIAPYPVEQLKRKTGPD
jgi:hypothetical protein